MKSQILCEDRRIERFVEMIGDERLQQKFPQMRVAGETPDPTLQFQNGWADGYWLCN